MQSEHVNNFSAENLTVFEAMVTQLAVAIDGARQWALAQEAQQRLEEVVSRLTRDAWAAKLVSRNKDLGFSYDLAAVKPLDNRSDNGDVVVPVAVQNEPIGQLAVNLGQGRELSTEQKELLAAVAQQLGQKAETLRLFEETQQQAAREQIARQISDKVRASQDIETALRTAATELGRALGTTRTMVDLRLPRSKDDGEMG